MSISVYRGIQVGGLSGGPSNLEKVWRALIPVESFTKDPEPIVPPIEKPVVGIRWGKPATFEFLMHEAKVRNQIRQGLTKEVPRVYFENDIVEFAEVYREFRAGKITVRPDSPELVDDAVWPLDYDFIPLSGEKQYTVEVEQSTSWITPTDISYQRFDSNGDPIANVSVFYNFKIANYLIHNEQPKTRMDERGEKPE